jgi:hypothetical protein
MNRKRCERKWSWPNLRYYPGIFLNVIRSFVVFVTTYKNTTQGQSTIIHPSRIKINFILLALTTSLVYVFRMRAVYC